MSKNARAALAAAAAGEHRSPEDVLAWAEKFKEWLDGQDALPDPEPWERCLYTLFDGSKPAQCTQRNGHGGRCTTEDGRHFGGGPFFGRA